ncbi:MULTISPECIES: hypothetical protein [Burkholderia]|uniref:Uncharacterized protein n=1 Tax=Burkholderia cenocepacia TaxID=95486 RepID=A0ABD4UCC2_9BURK|nr:MULTISPECIES: hypothetical protein [Burkholderia]MCW3696276.1 hypothetical protein [Burkholderia cenocepacia]MCW3704505.1 hypothetical protein [Burkholderia cenocepacia]MCW3712056.1 hypothetical protein [Burkholderia cenocepacia]MCW3720055.1 hypothetical protein [Burkholderia cenocepacia]MCW3727881.1 hypothetical protein [Burkholderia cenocepacia]
MENIQKQIEEVAEQAQLAFWAEVAKSFPEVKSGDLPVQAVLQFNKACEQAVAVWLKSNHPNYPTE